MSHMHVWVVSDYEAHRAREVLPPAPIQCPIPCEVLAARWAHEQRVREQQVHEEHVARERAEWLEREREAQCGPPRPRKRVR